MDWGLNTCRDINGTVTAADWSSQDVATTSRENGTDMPLEDDDWKNLCDM